LKRIGLRQLPCGRPVEVEQTLVKPKGKIKYKILRDNSQEIKFIKQSGRFNDWSAREVKEYLPYRRHVYVDEGGNQVFFIVEWL